jgi:4-amino-4-deoxy-L-arabinose transferase-like glycosyltransferase
MSTERVKKITGWLILLGSFAIRLVVFGQNRSLFLDEANLARNIAERSFGALWLPLSYQQSAPPLFSMSIKTSTLLLGHTEWALRLIPLLAGLGSLILFYLIAKRLLSSGVIFLFALWVISFHQGLLHYATECKQYSTDVFITLLLVWLALKYADWWHSWKQTMAWILLGLLCMMYSMPSIFVLASICIYFLAHHWQTFRRVSKRHLFAFTTWGLGFALFYFLILKPQVGSQQLQAYHADYYFPLLPTSAKEWSQLFYLLHQVIKDFAGPTVMGLVVGGIGLAGGLFYWIIEKKREGLLIFLPILATIVASGLHLYSLMSRLILFLVPLLVITWAVGWDYLLKYVSRRWKVAGWVLILFLVSLHTSYRYFWNPFQIEEIRPALKYLEAHQKENEKLYLSRWAQPAFRYYTQHYQIPIKIELDEMTDPGEATTSWLLYNHLIADEEWDVFHREVNQFKRMGAVTEVYRNKGVRLLYFERRE